MRPFKEMIDQFVSEGVLVSDNSCDFASPLVIVNKKDGGIRMAVDYREVNKQGVYSQSASLLTIFISTFGWSIFFKS